MTTIPLSVVICTKNEEDNIDMCLGSLVGWADEIVVVDDESQDKTVELVKKYTDKIYFRKMDVEGTHRNWAYAQASNEWVLSLDADEYVTDELKGEIREAIQNLDISCYSVPLRNFIGSYQVRYSGWYPAGKARLFQKSLFRYEDVKVHPRAFVEGKQGHLTKDIVHKGYPDFEHFLSSLNRQTTLEAQKWIETGHQAKRGKLAWRSFDRFFRTYLRKKGYKDGFIGFMISVFASIYQTISFAKYMEFKSGNAALSHKDQPSPEVKAWDGPSVPLTVLVLTKNEEDNIEDCLRSIHGWAGEIMVFDDNSTDRTREIATRYANKVILETWENEGMHRNSCMCQAKYDWVMNLDADEMVTDELRHELAEEIKKAEYDSMSLPLKTYIGKTWVRHCGWYPAHKLRVMDRRKQWYKEERVHPTLANSVTCKKLTHNVFHKGYPDLEHFLGSVNRQSTAEAQKWIEEGREMSFAKAMWRAFDRFPRIYFRKQGYKDGNIGFMVAYFASLYQIMSYAKYWQIKREKTFSSDAAV